VAGRRLRPSVDYDQRERWFLARVAAFDPVPAGLTADEVVDLRGWRWWTAAELEATGDDLVPRALAGVRGAAARRAAGGAG
jgi:hypothetical protein